MSLGFSGLHTPCRAAPVVIEVASHHPLIQLALVIPWHALAEMVLPDLKSTTSKGKWWLGRNLKLRIHLGALLLQWLYDLSDRQVEWAMKDNAAYQLFCGCGIVENWHVPDHTKIEEFRSRLSPETQRQIANQVAVWATQLGFADPSKMDIDATIQEANIAYPSDAHLMVKMTLLVNKVWTYMKKNVSFFRKDAEKKKAAFAELWYESCTQICNVKKYFEALRDYDIERMPWNIRRALDQVNVYCLTYFLHVASFMGQGVIVPEKVLSFRAKAISCFNKGKFGKGFQFGRAFQLGRIGGNFLLAGSCTSLRMEDTGSVRPMIEGHQSLFGQERLKSCGTDRGYYSSANRKYLESLESLDEFWLQQPGVDVKSLSENDAELHARLVNRRSGIEPLIGHAKHGGQLGHSRMKQDETTMAAGYSAVGGFNLHQLVRHVLGKDIKVMQ